MSDVDWYERGEAVAMHVLKMGLGRTVSLHKEPLPETLDPRFMERWFRDHFRVSVGTSTLWEVFETSGGNRERWASGDVTAGTEPIGVLVAASLRVMR